MAKTTITGQPVSTEKTAPPRSAFRFAALVQFGAPAKFSDENPAKQPPAGELAEEPPSPEPPVDEPPAEEQPAEEPPQSAEMEGGTPVTIVARTGGVADQLFWGRCVHDFSGMSAPSVIPLDYMHDPMQIVGFANQIDAASGTLNIAGQIVSFAPYDRAAEILHRSKAGTPYQASILMGWNDFVSEDLPAGASAEVNGQTISGPVIIFRKWSLRGVAICPYGADAGTSIGLDGEAPPPAGTETPEPATDLTDEVPADDTPAAEMDGEVYLEEFGDRGGIYFAKGLTLSKARAQFAADLRAENAALKASLVKTQGQLSAGTAPVTFQSAEPVNAPSPANTTNLPKGLATFASGLKFRT